MHIPMIDLPGHEGRFGYFMPTVTGTKFFPCDPRPEEIFIEDIASGLAGEGRYSGQTTGFYSVAEHSVYCSQYKQWLYPKEKLMHDAAEAYIGDMIKPLKLLPGLGCFYKDIEARLERCIAERFDLVWPWPSAVKEADDAVATNEWDTIVNLSEEDPLTRHQYGAGIIPKCLPPKEAELIFLERFFELFGLYP